MKAKIVLPLCFLMFLFSFALLKLNSSSDILVVSLPPVYNWNTGLYYSSIQEAINADETLDGHIIEVDNGIYYEHVVLNKSVSLFGHAAIIDGEGNGTVVQVTASNLSIIDFSIRNSGSNSGDYGIYLNFTSNCTLRDNELGNNRAGLSLRNCTSCRLINNYAYNNTEYGILLDHSEDFDIGGNRADNNFWGIRLNCSEDCSICSNNVSDNEHGIWLDNSRNCQLEYNAAFHNENGICLNNCEDSDIVNENIAESNTFGIWLNSSRRCFVGGRNYAYYNSYGIRVDYSTYCHIGGNEANNNEYGVWLGNSENCQFQPTMYDYAAELDNNSLCSIYVHSSKSCLIEGAWINRFEGTTGFGGIILSDSTNCTVRDSSARNIGMGGGEESGCQLYSCSNCTVENNFFGDIDGMGISVKYSTECTLFWNQISNTSVGIWQYHSDDSRISSSDIGNNEYAGIHLASSNCIIEENRVYNTNYYGIYLEGDENTFYHNLFFNNTKHIENMWINSTTGGYNTWDDGQKGNYWDDYRGIDTDGDRIGETPYIIDGKNIDYFPLIGAPSDDYRPPIIGSCSITNALPTSSSIQQVNPFNIVTIQAQVVDQQTGVDQVTLRYGVDSLLNYSVNMLKTTGNWFNGTYEALICPWMFLDSNSWTTDGTQVNITFRVEATDDAKNIGTSENMTFMTAEQRNTLNIDIIIFQVNTQEELSIDLDFTLNGYLPAWMRGNFIVELENWRGGIKLDTVQLSTTPLLLNGQSTLNYEETLRRRLTLIGQSEDYPFDSYYLNLTFKFTPSLPQYLTDPYWSSIYSNAYSVIAENFYKWANVTLSVNMPHYVQQGLYSTWGNPEPRMDYTHGSYDETTGFEVNFALVRQLNNVLPLLLLLISTTYMIGATLLADARWNPEVKTAIYLSFFVMVAGFNFALRYLIPFRYGLTVAEVLFITLTVATAMFSIGVVISSILFARISEAKAKKANLAIDFSAICLSVVLLAIFSVPIMLLVIEIVGLFFGFFLRVAILDRHRPNTLTRS